LGASSTAAGRRHKRLTGAMAARNMPMSANGGSQGIVQVVKIGTFTGGRC
jgi:hypothetical protein